MSLTFHIWRQTNFQSKGQIVRYEARDINPDIIDLELWQLHFTLLPS